jgi:hypothetical protein
MLTAHCRNRAATLAPIRFCGSLTLRLCLKMHAESMDGVRPCARNDYAEPQAEQEALMLGKLRANEVFGT